MTQPLKFSKAWIDAFPNTFQLVESSYVENFVSYIINSKYRKSVFLRQWLKDLVAGVPTLVGEKHDDTALELLGKVKKELIYTIDNYQWSMSEYWQTPTETLQTKKGDCEDGAVLLYYYFHLLSYYLRSRLRLGRFGCTRCSSLPPKKR